MGEANKKIISVELLSEVLDREIFNVEISNDIKNRPDVYFNDYEDDINIHELAHKCKEWAIKQEFVDTISSLQFREEYYKEDLYDGRACVFYADKETPPMIFEEGSEIEAIFKACEWILDQTKESK